MSEGEVGEGDRQLATRVVSSREYVGDGLHAFASRMPGFEDGTGVERLAQGNRTAVEQHHDDRFPRQQQTAHAPAVDVVVLKDNNQVCRPRVRTDGTGQSLLQDGHHVRHQSVVARDPHTLHPCRVERQDASCIFQQRERFMRHLQGGLAEFVGAGSQVFAVRVRSRYLCRCGDAGGMCFVEHPLPGAHVGCFLLFLFDADERLQLSVGL